VLFPAATAVSTQAPIGYVTQLKPDIKAEASGFVTVVTNVSVSAGQRRDSTLQFLQIVSANQQVTVIASAPSSLTPDPAQSIIIHDQVLDANPGRPGAPISIPGLPIETASGGVAYTKQILRREVLAAALAITLRRKPRSDLRSVQFLAHRPVPTWPVPLSPGVSGQITRNPTSASMSSLDLNK